MKPKNLTPLYSLQAYMLTVTAVALIAFAKYAESSEDMGFLQFIAVIAVIHLFCGLGVTWKTQMSFRVIKLYLKMISFAYPIGTYMARFYEGYFREEKIGELFE